MPWTWIILLGSIAGLVGYEIWSAFVRREAPTLSEFVWRASGILTTCPNCGFRFKRRLVAGVAIAFGFGCLMGHFFL